MQFTQKFERILEELPSSTNALTVYSVVAIGLIKILGGVAVFAGFFLLFLHYRLSPEISPFFPAIEAKPSKSFVFYEFDWKPVIDMNPQHIAATLFPPTPTATEAPPTFTPTVTLTQTLEPTATITITPIDTITFTATITETGTPLPTATDTVTPTSTFTATPEDTPTPIPQTPTPSPTSGIFLGGNEISSPLLGLTYQQLDKIISQPYYVPNVLQDFGHHGVDFGSYDIDGQNIMNWPVTAVFSGKFAGSSNDRPPLGNLVIIETPYDDLPVDIALALDVRQGESLYAMYAHLDKPVSYTVGDTFIKGQKIGEVGMSQTSEAHLHLEMRIGKSNTVFQQMAYYTTNATDQELESYTIWRMSGDYLPFDPMTLFKDYSTP
jgi:murein DD-endopeptidase MepM/ murein hydrolase activator NlpD